MNLFKKKKLLTESEVLNKLNISSFKHISKEKIHQFSSMIPDIEPEVTKSILLQFPNFTKDSIEMVSYFKTSMGTKMDQKKVDTKQFYDSCDAVLYSLNELLKKDKLSTKQQESIASSISIILAMKNEKDKNDKKFINGLIGALGITTSIIIGVLVNKNK